MNWLQRNEEPIYKYRYKWYIDIDIYVIYLSIERETERKRQKRKDCCKELAQNCTVCSQQAGDPRELMVHVQFESWQAQDPEGANVLNLKVGKTTMSKLEDSQAEGILPSWGRFSLWFYSGFWLIGWHPSTLGKAISFTKSIDLHIKIIQKYPHTHTQ